MSVIALLISERTPGTAEGGWLAAWASHFVALVTIRVPTSRPADRLEWHRPTTVLSHNTGVQSR